MRNMVEEVRDQFARLAKAENDRGREHLVVIASEELSRRGKTPADLTRDPQLNAEVRAAVRQRLAGETAPGTPPGRP